MGDELDDVVREFLEESRENLDQVDLDLIALEKNPEDGSIIARVFRAIHTIKGTCGFLGFTKLESVSHAGENVLGLLRDEEIACTPALISVLLATVDACRKMLVSIEATRSEGDGDHKDLLRQLTKLSGGKTTQAVPLPPLPGSAAARITGMIAPIPVVAAPPPPPPAPTPTIPPPVATAPEPVHVDAPTPAESSIRVDVGLLDKLMNLVGELVLARNQIIQFRGANGDATFVGATQQLDLITSELQESVMKTRMQPIGNIWQKFPRIVRDLSTSCGKRVELVMEGESTELDKTLIEAIKDPLTHIVRNAVDHGIESPDKRTAKGKAPLGRLSLRAFHEGGQVNIEIADDGNGLDAERIRTKAVERGIVLAADAARMTERELYRLIFLPGFSTAEKITNVSGRGVGMDVVRTNIERIGGTIDLSSERGSGTTMKIKIPLTLAIIPAVVVASGANRYAIPQQSLVELVRVGDGDRVESIHGAPVYRLRGKLLPLVYLADALLEPHDASASYIVVLQADGRQFGLVVSDVHDTEEIVVKPLGKHFKSAAAFSGATIMGDGRVALILDIVGLAKRAKVIAEANERSSLKGTEMPSGSAATDDRQTLLLFRGPDDARIAIPLSRVARLEEFPRSAIEAAGVESLVQYRGDLMPVFDLANILVERRGMCRNETEPTPNLQIVVFSHGGGHVGLVVDEILDIVEDTIGKKRAPSREGVLGSVVIHGRVTELLDVEAVLRRAQMEAADVA